MTSQLNKLNNMSRGVYHAAGVYHANSEVSDYFTTISDPFNCRPVSIPDEDVTPHIVKTVNYNQNYTVPNINNSAGMAVFPTSSSRQAIRLYGYDPATTSMNYLEEVFPDQPLSENFVRGRNISTGLQLYSNTVSQTNATLSGSVNSVAYNTLPPLNQITPGTLTTYKMDNINVVSQATLEEGVAMVGPLFGQRNYQVFSTDTIQTADPSVVIDTFRQGLFGGPVAAGGTVWIFDSAGLLPAGIASDTITQFSGSMPNPLPWGQMRIRVDYDIAGTLTANGLTGGNASLNYATTTADPATYARTVTGNTVAQCVTNCTGGVAGEGVTSHITLNASVYSPAEIANLYVIQTFSNLQNVSYFNLSINVWFDDYYNYLIKEPGTIALWQNVTPNQQLSLNGISHWEVIPNATLTQNVASYYSVDDPDKFVAATTYYFTRLGSPFRFVYPRYQFLSMQSNGAFQLDSYGIVAHAASFKSRLLGLLKSIGRGVVSVLPAVGTAVGGAVGGPAGAAALGGLGTLIKGSVSRSASGPSVAKQGGYRAGSETEQDGEDGGAVVELRSASDSITIPDSEDELIPFRCPLEPYSYGFPPGFTLNGAYDYDYQPGGPVAYAASKFGTGALEWGDDDSEEEFIQPADDSEEEEEEEEEEAQAPAKPRKQHPWHGGPIPSSALYAGKGAAVGDWMKGARCAFFLNPSMLVDNLPKMLPAIGYFGEGSPSIYYLTRMALTVDTSNGPQPLLAHFVVSNKPIEVPPEQGECIYQQFGNYSDEVKTDLYIESHIKNAGDAASSRFGVIANLFPGSIPYKLSWPKVYFSIIPYGRSLMAVDGSSWELAAAIALRGGPGDLLYTGCLDDERTTDLVPKFGLAQDLGTLLFTSQPQKKAWMALEAVLTEQNLTARIPTAFMDQPYQVVVIQSYNQLASLITFASLSGLTAATSSEVVTGVGSKNQEEAKRTSAAYKKAVEATTKRLVTVGKHYAREFKRSEVLANWNKWLGELKSSNRIVDKAYKRYKEMNDEAKMVNWVRLANLYGQLEALNAPKEKKKKKPKKKVNPYAKEAAQQLAAIPKSSVKKAAPNAFISRFGSSKG